MTFLEGLRAIDGTDKRIRRASDDPEWALLGIRDGEVVCFAEGAYWEAELSSVGDFLADDWEVLP